MKYIYLIRHGETRFNKMGVVQGSGIDSVLNETGQKQAEAFFHHYGHIPFDKVYTSSLKRSIQSVEGFLDKGIPVEKHSGLNEISWGNHEGKEFISSSETYYNSVLKRWQKGELHLRIAGGESPLDVAKRQHEVMKLILSRKEEKNVLVCMHGRAMRIFLCQLMKLPLTEMDKFSHHNLGLYLIKVHEEGEIMLEKENCLLHLDSLL